jgi:hypothetical protein
VLLQPFSRTSHNGPEPQELFPSETGLVSLIHQTLLASRHGCISLQPELGLHTHRRAQQSSLSRHRPGSGCHPALWTPSILSSTQAWAVGLVLGKSRPTLIDIVFIEDQSCLLGGQPSTRSARSHVLTRPLKRQHGRRRSQNSADATFVNTSTAPVTQHVIPWNANCHPEQAHSSMLAGWSTGNSACVSSAARQSDRDVLNHPPAKCILHRVLR